MLTLKTILFVILLCGIAASQNTQPASWVLSAAGVSSEKAAEARWHTVAAVPSGSPAICTLRLEGSLDHISWFDLSGDQTCTASLMFHVADKPVQFVRINLTALSGGSSPSVAVRYAGVQ